MITLINIKNIQEFQDIIKSKDKILIELKTNTCPLCAKLEIVFENINLEHNVYVFNLQNMGLEDDFISSFIKDKQLKGVPVLMVYQDGIELENLRKIGFMNYEELTNYLKSIF